MALARLKNLAKLTLLIGTPIALLVGIFSCGVYCGHENRNTVLKFERDWLGFDVTVPGEPVPVKTEPPPVKTEPTPVKTEPVKPEPVKTEPTPVVKTEPTPVQPVPEPVVLAKVEEPLPFPMPEPTPLSGESRAKLDDPVRISVKVLVDPALADAPARLVGVRAAAHRVGLAGAREADRAAPRPRRGSSSWSTRRAT
jgi:hypothetical protein